MCYKQGKVNAGARIPFKVEEYTKIKKKTFFCNFNFFFNCIEILRFNKLYMSLFPRAPIYTNLVAEWAALVKESVFLTILRY